MCLGLVGVAEVGLGVCEGACVLVEEDDGGDCAWLSRGGVQQTVASRATRTHRRMPGGVRCAFASDCGWSERRIGSGIVRIGSAGCVTARVARGALKS